MSSSSCTCSSRRLATSLALGGLLVGLAGTARADATADYRRFCTPCHGSWGDGTGPSAHLLRVLPRDFTKGTYKFRSTESGFLPRNSDLLRVITEGLLGTEMAGWQTVIPWERRRALVEVLKSFSARFREEPPGPVVPLPPEPPRDPRSVARGREVWVKMKCAECHGDGGRGDGPSVPTLVDDWGRSIVPSDLTRRDDLRRGAPRDMMMVMLTGLDGTPMPSYMYAAQPDENWDMVRYMLSLQRATSRWTRFFLDPPLAWRGAR